MDRQTPVSSVAPSHEDAQLLMSREHTVPTASAQDDGGAVGSSGGGSLNTCLGNPSQRATSRASS